MSATVPSTPPNFAAFVERQLAKVRAGIRTNDLLLAAAGLFVVGLAYSLLFLLLDQWLIPGGLSPLARWLGLAALVVGGLLWGIGQGLRPSLREVSPLFAARQIERNTSTLHDSLLNWVDLRAAGRPVDPAIWNALERRTAAELSRTDVSQAIDTRRLLLFAYLSLGLVVLFCLYALVSPKQLTPSLLRMIPFADIAPPTRTEIRAVKPGDTTVLAGSRLEITVELAGDLPAAAEVLFTTVDGKFTDEVVPLQPSPEGPSRFVGWLSGESGRGLLQDVTYRVSAGDARSPVYRVVVKQPPSATVESVRVVPPAYTGLEPVSIAGGTLEAWEGSVATLAGSTNVPIESAVVQLFSVERAAPTGEEFPVSVLPAQRWEANWNLAFPEGAPLPEQYRVVARVGNELDPAPTIYDVRIRRDLAPEVAFLQPDRDVRIAANARLELLVEARDPDFQLGYVYLHVEKRGEAIHRELLSEGRVDRVLVRQTLNLERLRPRPGEELELYVEAFDNRQPQRNRKTSSRIRVTILPPATPEQNAAQQVEQDQQADARQAAAERERAAEEAAQAGDPTATDSADSNATEPGQNDPASTAQGSPEANSSDETTEPGAGSTEQESAEGAAGSAGQAGQPGEAMPEDGGSPSDSGATSGPQSSGEQPPQPDTAAEPPAEQTPSPPADQGSEATGTTESGTESGTSGAGRNANSPANAGRMPAQTPAATNPPASSAEGSAGAPPAPETGPAANPGSATPGPAKTGQGKTGQGKTGAGKTGQGKTGPGQTEPGNTGRSPRPSGVDPTSSATPPPAPGTENNQAGAGANPGNTESQNPQGGVSPNGEDDSAVLQRLNELYQQQRTTNPGSKSIPRVTPPISGQQQAPGQQQTPGQQQEPGQQANPQPGAVPDQGSPAEGAPAPTAPQTTPAPGTAPAPASAPAKGSTPDAMTAPATPPASETGAGSAPADSPAKGATEGGANENSPSESGASENRDLPPGDGTGTQNRPDSMPPAQAPASTSPASAPPSDSPTGSSPTPGESPEGNSPPAAEGTSDSGRPSPSASGAPSPSPSPSSTPSTNPPSGNASSGDATSGNASSEANMPDGSAAPAPAPAPSNAGSPSGGTPPGSTKGASGTPAGDATQTPPGAAAGAASGGQSPSSAGANEPSPAGPDQPAPDQTGPAPSGTNPTGPGTPAGSSTPEGASGSSSPTMNESPAASGTPAESTTPPANSSGNSSGTPQAGEGEPGNPSSGNTGTAGAASEPTSSEAGNPAGGTPAASEMTDPSAPATESSESSGTPAEPAQSPAKGATSPATDPPADGAPAEGAPAGSPPAESGSPAGSPANSGANDSPASGSPPPEGTAATSPPKAGSNPPAASPPSAEGTPAAPGQAPGAAQPAGGKSASESGGAPSSGPGSNPSGSGGETTDQPGKGMSPGTRNASQGEGFNGMTTRDGSTGSGTGDSPALTTDEANLEHNRKAAELVLSQLEEDLNQGTVDPELLKELGWTPEQMSRFAQRLGEQLRTPVVPGEAQDDARRQQFEEMLRSLDVNQNSSTRVGDKSVVREVDQSATRRSAPPPEYRRAFDTFTRKLSKQPRTTAPGKP